MRPQAPRPAGTQPPAARPLPPEYEPVHHDPRSDRPRPGDRPPGDSPWRQAQRRFAPEGADLSGQPGAARQAQGSASGNGPGGQAYPPGGRAGRGEPGRPADEGYDDAGTFVPGFGGGADERDDDYAARQPTRAARRPSRGAEAPASPGRGGRSGRAKRPPTARKPRRRRFRWIAPWVALLIILIPLGIAGGYGYSFYMSKYHPADYAGGGTGKVVVQVTSGSTPTSLGPELVKLGVVASSRAFVLAAEHSSNPSGLLPGFYSMHEHMKATLAYARLLNAANLVQVTVTIPEGWRVSQAVGWLGKKSGISASNYDKVLKDPASLDLPASAHGNPEGYLFPATYQVVPHETALSVLKAMVQRFDQESAAVNLPSAAKQAHLTEAQVITMASLVEAEGGSLSDYPKIARVIYNRLAQNMPLQLDSTVLFGLNTYGIIASDSQLQSNSPYNTYKHKGLPPGPIDSPGNAAIQAVLHPDPGNWLYFVTVNPKTGETLFTNSQSQFQQFRAELEKNLGQG